MRVEIEDLIDLEGIASRAGVNKSAVTNWRTRHESFADCEIEWDGYFPLFQWSKVRRWLIRTGRLEKSAA